MNEKNTPNRRSRQNFTIIKDDSTDGHGGYGAGSISLENMSSIIVDPEDNNVYLDMDAMHARSAIERRVRYHNDKAEVPEGRLYWITWVTVEAGENGLYYYGLTASELLVDKPNKRAYKSLPEHVKHMEQSLAGKVVVEHMDNHSKKLLGDYLKNYEDGKLWEHATEEVKAAFS